MRIFCSGIGGIGLSAYAAHMRTQGHDVSGSDRAPSAVTQSLEKMGIAIGFVQDGSLLPKECDLLVYSEAIPADGPERSLAKKRGVRELSYFHALGELTDGTNLVCVCGTHGKSSTTAMAAKLLIDSGKDPSVVVGTKMKELSGTNWRAGKGNLWVVEACEYRRSFLFLKPKLVLFTTADGDHFDTFKDQEDYEYAFREFFALLPSDGHIIFHGSDPVTRRIAESSGKMLIDADTMPLPELSVPGKHMRENAQLVLALASHLGISEKNARASLKGFSGTWRRMEERGTLKNGVTVIDDYAHHPAEIRATLQAMREAYPGRRIVTVFQPHTHDRTLRLWDDFTVSFKDADLVIITNIYDARPDRDSALADPAEFAEAIAAGSRVETRDGRGLKETEKLLTSNFLKSGDVLVVMGAGNVTSIADAIVR